MSGPPFWADRNSVEELIFLFFVLLLKLIFFLIFCHDDLIAKMLIYFLFHVKRRVCINTVALYHSNEI